MLQPLIVTGHHSTVNTGLAGQVDRTKEPGCNLTPIPGIECSTRPHSFIDRARECGSPVYSVAKILGHKDLGVTEHYLKGFDEVAADEEMERLFADSG